MFSQFDAVTVKTTGQHGLVATPVCGTYIWIQLTDIERPTRVLYHASELATQTTAPQDEARAECASCGSCHPECTRVCYCPDQDSVADDAQLARIESSACDH